MREFNIYLFLYNFENFLEYFKQKLVYMILWYIVYEFIKVPHGHMKVLIMFMH
jgi:hypothetical protein